MEINLTSQQKDDIVVQVLKEDREAVAYNESSLPLFSFDLDEEQKLREELVKAFDRLIEYYGG